MSKLNLEGISNYVDYLSRNLDEQLSDKLYVIHRLDCDDVESDKVADEVIKELKKKYVVNYCVARTSEMSYIIVITKDSYLSMNIEDEVLDLLYKDVTDEVDKVTEKGYYYGCDIKIYDTLDLSLYRGIAERLEGYKDSYNLKVCLEGKHGDNPRNLRVRWDEDWVHDYSHARLEEFYEKNPIPRVSARDILSMSSGEFYLRGYRLR